MLETETQGELIDRLIELRRQRLVRDFTGPNGLLAFVRHFWSILEPNTEFVEGWVLQAICAHLYAVSEGEITRLLINVPPGFMKSLLVDVFWPAWEWAIYGNHLRYVTFSYSASLTRRDNRRFAALVTSPEYQLWFGDKITPVKIGEELVSNAGTGWKLASSVGGVATGERGDRVILDDPHNVIEIESKIVREETVRWFRESMSNRLNNLETGAIVIIMQRLHFDDVSGVILGAGMDYCHLMVPMIFDYGLQSDENFEPRYNELGWYDPRHDDYEPNQTTDLLAWPERFPQSVLDQIRKEGSPYSWAGQYQQTPIPRGAGIFKRSWWQLWDSPTGSFPVCDMVVASVDSAFTAKERNDPTGMTVWGRFHWKDPVTQEERPRAILLWAWRKHLPFSGELCPVLAGESYQMWEHRTREKWGLVEWIRHTCRLRKVDVLLIEAKASGISAAQELSNRYGRANFGIEPMPVKGDKEARALSVQWVFANELVFAPIRDWSELLMEEMESFPMHKYDDLTDSATMAMRYFIDHGLLIDDPEYDARLLESITHVSKPRNKVNFW